MRTSITLLAAVAAAMPVFAQNAAPRDNPTVQIGGNNVAVEYGRPSLGENSVSALLGQLPADRMWRAGSEQVSTFSTDGPIVIGDAKVDPGKYSLYVHCGEGGDFSLVLNKVLGQPLGKIYPPAADGPLKDEPWPHFDYANEIADSEVARVAMVKGTPGAAVDRFTIELMGGDENGGLKMSWGDQVWSVSLKAAQ